MANTRPHQLCWGDREMGTAISCIECSQMVGLIHKVVKYAAVFNAAVFNAVVFNAAVFHLKIVSSSCVIGVQTCACVHTCT